MTIEIYLNGVSLEFPWELIRKQFGKLYYSRHAYSDTATATLISSPDPFPTFLYFTLQHEIEKLGTGLAA